MPGKTPPSALRRWGKMEVAPDDATQEELLLHWALWGDLFVRCHFVAEDALFLHADWHAEQRVARDSWSAVAGEVMAPFYEAENTASQPPANDDHSMTEGD